ncbi:MAG: TraR/DksA family transcriptional regulator [Planctomycetota bacterium]|jgi:RNA polymerase-binding protein DksA
MAKKKVTKKKTTRTTRRKTAGSSARGKTRTVKKAATKKKTTKKKTTKKKTAKKTAAKRAPTKKKTQTRKKTAAATKVSTRKTTTKKKTTSKKAPSKSTAAKRPAAGKRKAAQPGPKPDADGYVVINGRRVRMMSAAMAAPVNRKTSARSAPSAMAETKEVKSKPIKSKLTRKQLDQYRDLLVTKRSQLIGDLSALEEQALQSGGSNASHMPIHMADIGTDTYDQDFMLGLAETERRGLREIDEALRRIEDGTYGICQLTGKPIPKARLNAKPWAKYTVEAARMVESGLGG